MDRFEKIRIAVKEFKYRWPTAGDDLMSRNPLTGAVKTWASSTGADVPFMHEFLCTKQEFEQACRLN